MYYIAGSTPSYLSKAVGRPRDQKSCLTCVSYAMTEAVEMAVASALRISRAQLERKRLTVSPTSLYYCTPGLPLSTVVTALVMSSTCVKYESFGLGDPHSVSAAH
jgi:hypothetical protein